MSQLSKVARKLAHYTSKAIADYRMINKGDRVMVCLSGGKDSYGMLSILHHLRIQSHYKFDIFAFILDQNQPGWDDSQLRAWLNNKHIPFEILSENTYDIVKEKTAAGKTYCGLCSRLRRGIIYRYAEEHGYNKIALGHHRDDLNESLLMSIFFNGEIKTMPPKLLSDDKKHIVIRPLVYCQEEDLITYSMEQKFPIIPCNLCGSQDNLARQKMKRLLAELKEMNEKIPSNMLHALKTVRPSQLMDRQLWSFKDLEQQQSAPQPETPDSVQIIE
jgi:tRNA 2-thiocytidine biosynthesis protein TtcA